MAFVDFSTFLSRLRALFHRTRLDRDLDDELAFHLAMRQEEQIRQGAAPADADVDPLVALRCE